MKEIEQTDKRLVTPSEANTEKHINLLEVEEQGAGREKDNQDEFAEERRKQWQEGLEEGRTFDQLES